MDSGGSSLFLDSCSKAGRREVGCTVSSGSCVPISRCTICSLARLQRKSAMRHSMTRQRAGVAWSNALVSAFLSVVYVNVTGKKKQQSMEIANLTTNTHTALFMSQSNWSYCLLNECTCTFSYLIKNITIKKIIPWWFPITESLYIIFFLNEYFSMHFLLSAFYKNILLNSNTEF